MQNGSQDDELLSVLLVNLRNAAATLGEGSRACEDIKLSIQEHIMKLQANGQLTNITGARQAQSQQSALSQAFEKLNIDPTLPNHAFGL
ncbi:hypothetical protein KC343_g7450 [Hortaea werneckii]|nr:hypothetical protein KC352_g14714 [Hortaea werneckii]KAI7566279.1 hypothetical protein KC317_g5775 [Hortaea werneckii]KAI7617529.1 hypothetical protein KC346_g5418 [Hortaea werneckii]KAI7623060.1 hypothetical protein KC343_g7450 [Hortaea werneckii]KAI7660636.1 hypothetical protein KC319_g8617 [Hortaea werneckii]